MEEIKPYIGITYIIFLVVYWIGTGILMHHLKKHGVGKHIQFLFYTILIVSIFLTFITSVFYLNI